MKTLKGLIFYTIIFIGLFYLIFYLRKQPPSELLQTIKDNDIHKVEDLIKNGLNINETYERGLTPIHLACEIGTVEIVNKLLEYGADVNSRTSHKVTPLHLAVQEGKTEIINLLIIRGAEVTAEDDEGVTPLVWAERYVEIGYSKAFDEYRGAVEILRYSKEFRDSHYTKRNNEEYQQYIDRLKELR